MKILNRCTGEIIMETEMLSGADLREANLRRADLTGENLRGADLRGADLRGADLRGADLRGADLRGSYLRGADLTGADLTGADLTGADLRCYGDMSIIRTMQIDTWHIGFTNDTLQIGCQRHSIEEWRNFSDDVIANMDCCALEWWKKWKEPLFSIIDLATQPASCNDN